MMKECPICGYKMQEFERICPRCEKKYKEPEEKDFVRHSIDTDPEKEIRKRNARKTALLSSGALAGAIYGIVFLITVVMIDRVIPVGATHFQNLSLFQALVRTAIGGAILGAIIGVGTVFTRSVGTGIAAGAVVVGFSKVAAALSLKAPSATITMSLIMGLIYGAVMGWAVASSVMRSIKWDLIDRV